MLVPEIFRQFHDTRVSLIYRLEHLVTGVVLSNQSESFGLGTHTDILRHKNHWTSKKTFLKAQCDRQYLVIVLPSRKPFRQFKTDILGLQEKTPACQPIRGTGQRDSLIQRHSRGLCSVENLTQQTHSLTRTPSDPGLALLMVIEFFQNDNGNEDVVITKTIETHRIMHQDVGIQDEQFLSDC